jgi:hypothetical protein
LDQSRQCVSDPGAFKGLITSYRQSRPRATHLCDPTDPRESRVLVDTFEASAKRASGAHVRDPGGITQRKSPPLWGSTVLPEALPPKGGDCSVHITTQVYIQGSFGFGENIFFGGLWGGEFEPLVGVAQDHLGPKSLIGGESEAALPFFCLCEMKKKSHFFSSRGKRRPVFFAPPRYSNVGRN